MSPKKTSLYSSHIALNAHMVEFAKTWLPVRYHSETKEYMAVRTAVGMFDVSHMGEIWIEGEECVAFLQKLLTRDISKLVVGKAQYALMLNDKAGIVDDVIVYRLDNYVYLICINAANIEKDYCHVVKAGYSPNKCSIKDVSEQFSQIALQGPKAAMLLASLCSDPLPAHFYIKELLVAGVKVWVARTGYTGEDGFELFLENQHAQKLWTALLENGQLYGLEPCGLAARDLLRLEAGLLLYGQDMDETITPLESGLMFAVDMDKQDFLGKQALLEQQSRGVTKKLVGFYLLERGLARPGFNVLDLNKQLIGSVTSAGYLPQQQKAIGLAYIPIHQAQVGQEVLIDIRGRLTKAKLSKPKFMDG